MTERLPDPPFLGKIRLCSCKGCGRIPVVAPTLVFPPAERLDAVHQGKPPSQGPGELHLDYPVCDRHQAELGVEDFLKRLWDKIELKHARLRLAMPKRKQVWLKWRQL